MSLTIGLNVFNYSVFQIIDLLVFLPQFIPTAMQSKLNIDFYYFENNYESDLEL